jgi:alkylation response protein AidB-like acyl-CoA dehydrogenase
MRFAFEEEQLRFRDSVRGTLERVCPPAAVRAVWEREQAHDGKRWKALADLGVLGLLVPEHAGGLGLDETSLVLPLEEAGRAALPEAVVETAAVAAPLLSALEDGPRFDPWFACIAAGETVVTVGCEPNPGRAMATSPTCCCSLATPRCTRCPAPRSGASACRIWIVRNASFA